MSFTKKIIAALNITKTNLEIVLFEKRGKKFEFIAAEMEPLDRLHFSQDVNQLYKAAYFVIAPLKAEDVLIKRLEMPEIKRHQKKILKNLFQKKFHFFDEEGHVEYIKQEKQICAIGAHLSSIQKTLNSYENIGYEPNFLTCYPMALSAFASHMCEKQKGVFVFLNEHLGHIIAQDHMLPFSSHTFYFEKNFEKIAKQIQWFLNNLKDFPVDDVFVTGPLSFNQELIHYLEAALLKKVKKPILKKTLLPFGLCHSFAISIGSVFMLNQNHDFKKAVKTDQKLKSRLRTKIIKMCAQTAGVLALLGLCFHFYFLKKENALVESMNVAKTYYEKELQIKNVFKKADIHYFKTPNLSFEIAMFEKLKAEGNKTLKHIPNTFLFPTLKQLVCVFKKCNTQIESFRFDMTKDLLELKVKTPLINLEELKNHLPRADIKVNNNVVIIKIKGESF